ncbi:MAG: hypothetical protein ACRC6G_05610, partial [Deefgea sp.]
MAFLNKKDYLILIDAENLEVVAFSKDEGTTAAQLIADTEENVIQEISSYLAGRYDVAKIFFHVYDYLNGETYNPGDFIHLSAPAVAAGASLVPGQLITKEDGAVYRVLTAGTPTTATFEKIGINGAYYTALTATLSNSLFTDPLIFEPGDRRNALIKRHVINIALYELHSRINPRNIPEFRIQRRDDSIQWLKLVQNPRNNIDADFLPKRDFG